MWSKQHKELYVQVIPTTLSVTDTLNIPPHCTRKKEQNSLVSKPKTASSFLQRDCRFGFPHPEYLSLFFLLSSISIFSMTSLKKIVWKGKCFYISVILSWIPHGYLISASFSKSSHLQPGCRCLPGQTFIAVLFSQDGWGKKRDFYRSCTPKAPLLQASCHGQRHLALDQAAHKTIQPDLGQFQGWTSTTLGNLCQSLAVLVIKNFFLVSSLNLVSFSWKPLPFGLSLQALEMSF